MYIQLTYENLTQRGDRMADSKVVIKLDQRLIREKVIDRAYSDDYQTVHRMLNSIIKKSGGKLTEKTFEKGEAKLRKWLISLYKRGASQEKLTSYLRCGLAHLSFDFIESSYKTINTEDLITRTLQSFKKREFNKTYFKAPDLPKSKKKAVKKPVKKKKTVKKKAAKKKKSVRKKTAVKKKIRAVKKKKAPVKRKAKKKTAKKTKKRGKSKKVSFSRRKKGGFLKSIFG